MTLGAPIKHLRSLASLTLYTDAHEAHLIFEEMVKHLETSSHLLFAHPSFGIRPGVATEAEGLDVARRSTVQWVIRLLDRQNTGIQLLEAQSDGEGSEEELEGAQAMLGRTCEILRRVVSALTVSHLPPCERSSG